MAGGGWLIWHNPRCSTSRFVLAALRAAGLAPMVRDYQADPPDAAELRRAIAAAGLATGDLVRRKSEPFKQIGGDILNLPEAELLALLAQHPAMIERPLLFGPDGRARLCRPKEIVFEMLGTVG